MAVRPDLRTVGVEDDRKLNDSMITEGCMIITA